MEKELYVLTGFLGAGKTSLLLHLLDNTDGGRTGVIQNEFGKLSIDGDILRRGGLEMKEIGRGSIFCSCLKQSFVQALCEMAVMELDRVFVESSGLADPSNLEKILAQVRESVGEVYRPMGVICLVDGVNFPMQLKYTETVGRQLAHCNMAVINKTDLLSATQLENDLALIKSVNPICRIEACVNGQIPLDFLGTDMTRLQWAACEDSTNTVDSKPKTFSLECGEAVSRSELMKLLEKITPELYRVKGFFLLEDGWYQVDTVEKLIDLKPCAAQERSRLVFLSKTGPQAIRMVDSAWRDSMSAQMKLHN